MNDKIPVQACVRSGVCCKKAPCGYGIWNKTQDACEYLLSDDRGIHSCGKYEEISKDESAKFSPAFGYGCCMPLWNQEREDIIERDYGGKIPTVLIDNFYI
ncbi:hypothetical protein C9J27_02845 [Photobacterium kishitanii]|uniref:Uncharacterized protein n=1 Tax=Photobacterium kishitanii TaxID=318456 RepID=A0A2T3KMF3_9GAMM|nr:hypothetical protein C9J27_02845 [Photobacterium kishitanii]